MSCDTQTPKTAKYNGYEFYEKVLGSPKLIVAPMVEQSELAFRMMTRKYGAQLCYTPMWHAGIFIRDTQYRKDALQSCPEDRPLIVQFCANDPDIFVRAGLLAEAHCDAIDLNLGCPQVIARRGHYGAFLQDEWDLLRQMVSGAHEKLSVPITCKIRIFPEIEKTVAFAQMLERAGAQIITVHGRTRDQRGPLTGVASWDHIKAVKANVSIPVFANGNIQYGRDVERCLQYTSVDGIMCAEGVLYNPALFSYHQPPAWEMAEEYVTSAEKYSVLPGHVRGHLFRILHHVLSKHLNYRNILGAAKTVEKMKLITKQLREICVPDAIKDKEESNDSEEPGKLPYWRCQPYVRPPPKTPTKRSIHECEDENSSARPQGRKDENRAISRKAQKRIQRKGTGAVKGARNERWEKCEICIVNPKSCKCAHRLCRQCCRNKSAIEILDCASHNLKFKTKADLAKGLQATSASDSATGEVT